MRNPNLKVPMKVAERLGVPWEDVEYWAAFTTSTSGLRIKKVVLLVADDQIIYGQTRLALPGARAAVDTSGNTAMAQGWVVKERKDTRQLFLTIESDRSVVVQLPPDQERTARTVAAWINAHAGRVAEAEPAVNGGSGSDIPDQIRKLAELRDQGILTDAEFDAKKTELLAKL